MFFANIGIPPKMLKGLAVKRDKVITEPLVIIDGTRYSYALPIKGYGLPQTVTLYDIVDLEKFNEKIVKKFDVDLFEISAKNAENKKYTAFVVAAKPFQDLNLSLQYDGFKSHSKHLKGE